MTSRISEGRAIVDGVRTRTLSVEGAGPTILLIHGFTDFKQVRAVCMK